MNDPCATLLTVSGEIDPQIVEKTARGERPQADYMAMAKGFPADLLDYRAARKVGGLVGWLFEKVAGPNLMLAWACFCRRKYYRVLFTDGEQVGLPLAFLLKFFAYGPRPKHCMIAHRLSVRKKMILLDWLQLYSHIDIFFVYSTCQQAFVQKRWKLPACRVIFTPFMVDSSFFSPSLVPDDRAVPAGISHAEKYICAVGLEYRDYPTLIEAVHGLPVMLILAAASPWSKQRDTTAGHQLPENVLVRQFTQYQLRELYAGSQFVVMPLFPVDFQAGVTAILEAMAMGKAVICSRTPGQMDVIVDGKTGLYVDPGSPGAIRSAIETFLDHPGDVEWMGLNGRQHILEEMSLDCYVQRLGRIIADPHIGIRKR